MYSEHLLFGQILTERKLVNEDQLKQCLQLQTAEVDSGRQRRSLGDILVEVGYLTRAQLDLALADQRKRLKELTVGPYQIVDKLGQGGMGAVYRATVPDTGVEVALKILPKHYASDPNFLARFHREANLGMEMDHPHIVRTIDFGEHKGTFYLAMEVVEGGTLDSHLQTRGAIAERTALKIVRDLLSALEYAHGKGLIHRDIKPSNVLFDLEGQCKLSDFGLAKAQEPDPQFMTHGTTVGTPHYMAPEQARGEALDIRADLYALGATLYHAVTGRTPYSGSSAAVMQSHLRKELPPPRSVNPTLSPGCCAIITKLMAKDRNARYRTPGDAAEDVARILRSEPPLAAVPAALPVPATRVPVLAPTPHSSAVTRTPTTGAPASGVVPAPPARSLAPPAVRAGEPQPPREATPAAALAVRQEAQPAARQIQAAAPARQPPAARPPPAAPARRQAQAAPNAHSTSGRRRQRTWTTSHAFSALLWLAGIVVMILFIRFLVTGPAAPTTPASPPSAPAR